MQSSATEVICSTCAHFANCMTCASGNAFYYGCEACAPMHTLVVSYYATPALFVGSCQTGGPGACAESMVRL